MSVWWGHSPSKGIQKRFKLGVKGVIDSISDRLHPELRKDNCLRVQGFGNYQLQHNFHGNMQSVGSRKRSLCEKALLIKLINYCWTVLPLKKAKWLNQGE